MIFATDDIAAALHAGERWRADVRSATGKISVETTAAGEVMRIPETQVEITYRFESNAVCRKASTWKNPELLLPKVKASQMRAEARGAVNAWRWELELAQHRKETRLPLRFLFRDRAGKAMIIQRENFSRESARGPGGRRQSKSGSATVIFIALLATMLVLVTAEGRALFQLRREVKLLERQQIKRLNNSANQLGSPSQNRI